MCYLIVQFEFKFWLPGPVGGEQSVKPQELNEQWLPVLVNAAGSRY